MEVMVVLELFGERVMYESPLEVRSAMLFALVGHYPVFWHFCIVWECKAAVYYDLAKGLRNSEPTGETRRPEEYGCYAVEPSIREKCSPS